MVSNPSNRSSSNTNFEGNVNTTEYFDTYDKIPLANLRKMQFVESMMAILEIANIAMVLYVFYLVCLNGILSTSPVVRIATQTWHQSISIAYYIVWGLIGLAGGAIFFRVLFQNLTRIPLLQQAKLHKKQIYGDQKFITNNVETHEQSMQDSTQKLYKSSPLRDQRNYYKVNFLVIICLIFNLNYFPRKEGALPSFVESTAEIGVVTRPAEYFTYFIINILFIFLIIMLFMLLLLFSIRQLKDIHKVIEFKIDEEFNRQKNEPIANEWKPPMPKPWKKMTLQEQKEYQFKLIAIEKARLEEQKKLQIARLVKEEKDKLRLGSDSYKQQQKEQHELLKQEKEKKVEEKKREKYDFR